MKWIALILLVAAPSVYAADTAQYSVTMQFFNSHGYEIAGGMIATDGSEGNWISGSNIGYPALECHAKAGTTKRTLKSIRLFSGVKVRDAVVNGNLVLKVTFATVDSDAAAIERVPATACMTLKPKQRVKVEKLVLKPTIGKPTEVKLKSGNSLKYTFEPVTIL